MKTWTLFDADVGRDAPTVPVNSKATVNASASGIPRIISSDWNVLNGISASVNEGHSWFTQIYPNTGSSQEAAKDGWNRPEYIGGSTNKWYCT